MAERHVLASLDVSVPLDNAQGCYPCHVPTLCFMPHCPLVVFDNLFKTNMQAETMPNLVIFGNELTSESYQPTQLASFPAVRAMTSHALTLSLAVPKSDVAFHGLQFYTFPATCEAAQEDVSASCDVAQEPQASFHCSPLPELADIVI